MANGYGVNKNMAIEFIQFLRPNGKQKFIYAERSEKVEALASDIKKLGYQFEIEELSNGMIYMEVASIKDENVVASELCNNGVGVPIAIDQLIRKASIRLRIYEKERINEEDRNRNVSIH